MKHTLAIALVCLGTIPAIAAEPESPDRIDPLFDCSIPETFASRLAGLFWDQKESEESRLVLRLTGGELVETRKLTMCGEPLTVEFISGQMHTREELEKLHSNNLEWFRGKFPGLQGTYADERTGEIVLEIYTAEAGGVDVEALRRESESRLGAPLRVAMTMAKLVPAILNPVPAME
ncbi:hypothetical protein [Mesorhizobium sp. L-2-11]|uniref:hypothetical protein n=1 Tax=Mesorhizobium sp. L-2-11 TaxID=2744521 RepID=UPI0019282E78|nr:hypothetical protein [Mesorhizobium sp. L-2-11]BCH19567.1 hypothetical protein MesoLjLa_64180 [Mesorhizobium sp. L-2-11]